MSFSYDPSKLSEGGTDAVRWLIQDTDEGDPLCQDEEIEFALSENGSNKYRAAAALCDALVLQINRELAVKGNVSYDPAEKCKTYQEMAEKFRKQAMRRGVMPFAGGISVSDKESREGDADRGRPAFTRDLQQAPGSAASGLLGDMSLN